MITLQTEMATVWALSRSVSAKERESVRECVVHGIRFDGGKKTGFNTSVQSKLNLIHSHELFLNEQSQDKEYVWEIEGWILKKKNLNNVPIFRSRKTVSPKNVLRIFHEWLSTARFAVKTQVYFLLVK